MRTVSITHTAQRNSLALIATAVLGCGQSFAQPGDEPEEERVPPAIWIAHGESDNIGRSSAQISGAYDAVGVVVDIGRERERFSGGLFTDLQFRQYAGDDLEDEEVGTVAAFADLVLVPRRLSWIVTESFGQGATDPFAAVGPANRENINVFASGPRLDFPFGERSSLSLSGTYTDRRHEETRLLDSRSDAYEVGLFRQTSSATRLGIVADHSEIDYDDGLLSYTIRGAVLRYEKELASGDVLAELGQNELAVGGLEDRGPRALLAWTRGLGSRSRFSVTASQDFTDSGALFAFRDVPPLVTGSAGTNVILTPSPLENRRVELRYEIASSNTSIEFGIAAGEEDYQQAAFLNSETAMVHLAVQRTLTDRMSLTLLAQDIQRDFGDLAREDGDRVVLLSLVRRLGLRLFVQVDVGTYARDGTLVFDEQRYELRLRYQPAR